MSWQCRSLSAVYPGILESDIQVGSASVKYDESKIKKGDIEAKIEKAGYKVKK